MDKKTLLLLLVLGMLWSLDGSLFKIEKRPIDMLLKVATGSVL